MERMSICPSSATALVLVPLKEAIGLSSVNPQVLAPAIIFAIGVASLSIAF